MVSARVSNWVHGFTFTFTDLMGGAPGVRKRKKWWSLSATITDFQYGGYAGF